MNMYNLCSLLCMLHLFEYRYWFSWSLYMMPLGIVFCIYFFRISFHGNQNQFTRTHSEDNLLSMAIVNNSFYCFNNFIFLFFLLAMVWSLSLWFCHDNSWRDWHSNVHDNIHVLGFGGLDLLHCRCSRESSLPRLTTANTSTTCCCEHVINTAAAHIIWSPHSRPIQVELGKVEGFLSVLQLLPNALAKYLNIEQRAHWLPIQEKTNQMWHVMMPLCQIELDISDCAIYSFKPELCILEYDSG